MTDIAPFPDLLAEYFEIPEDQLEDKHVLDPRRSFRADVKTITATLHATDLLVSGLVYDVDTRRGTRCPRDCPGRGLTTTDLGGGDRGYERMSR